VIGYISGTSSGIRGLRRYCSILLEEVPVQRPIRRGFHDHLQHLHTFLEAGVSGTQPSGFQSLERDSKTVNMQAANLKIYIFSWLAETKYIFGVFFVMERSISVSGSPNLKSYCSNKTK